MFTTIIALISSSGITALLTWMLTRRKQTAEAQGAELKNTEQATKIWRELADELRKELASVKAEIQQLRKENSFLRTAMNKLGRSMTEHEKPQQ